MITSALIALISIGAAGHDLRIESSEDPLRVAVIARLSDELLQMFAPGNIAQGVASSTLKLCLIDDDDTPGPAIFGTYKRRDDLLVFAPRYQLVRRHLYRAYLSLPSGKVITVDYQVPGEPPSERPTVEKIYPSGNLLPANHLKFYIYFSKRMREGREVFDQIQLLDAQGMPMPDTWRRTELWSADTRRLTLWIHPGRVKRGVNLREEFGPVLDAGSNYSLLIAADVRAADGGTLRKSFTKKFRTGSADHERPLPQNWTINSPAAGTKQPLLLEFGEPLDHALAKRLIEVCDADGEVVHGDIALIDHETKWQFRPWQPWRSADYRLKANELLEDLAGNTPARVFDRDIEKPVDAKPRLSRKFRPTRD